MYVKLNRFKLFGSLKNPSDWKASISWLSYYQGEIDRSDQTHPEIKHRVIFLRLCMLN